MKCVKSTKGKEKEKEIKLVRFVFISLFFLFHSVLFHLKERKQELVCLFLFLSSFHFITMDRSETREAWMKWKGKRKESTHVTHFIHFFLSSFPFPSLFLLAFCAVMKEREARAKRPKEKRKRKTTHFSLSVPSCVLFAFLFLSLIFNVMEWSVMKREISERKGNTKDTEKNHTNSYILWSESYCCVLCVYFSFNLIRAFIAIKLNRKGKQRTQLIHQL